MECEICGKETEKPIKVEIDRNEFLVCPDCSKYGRKIEQEYEKKQVKVIYAKKILPPKSKITELLLVADYGKKIRAAREKKSLTTKELAEKLFEKESYLHRVEAQAIQPSDALIKKLEKFLGISLKEQQEQE